MPESASTMVLRSFHIPQDLEDKLRSLAFQLRCPKADLVRHFVAKGLDELTRQSGGGATWSVKEQRWTVTEDGAKRVRKLLESSPAAGANASSSATVAADIERLAPAAVQREAAAK